MSLHPADERIIPEETVRVARAAFPKGSVYMRLRDALGPIYTDDAFACLFPHRGQPAESPARLALVTILQFAEGLSDRQAADAVRSRIDWKYALGLALTDSGFDACVLSEFRSRLLTGDATQLLFERMLALVCERGLLKKRGRARTDSTHILAAIRTLNRLECVGETLRHALNTLATVAPDWLRSWVPSAWYDRYGRRFEEYRLPPGKAERYALAEQIGTEGSALLTALDGPDAPEWLRSVPAVETLRQVWGQQFVVRADPADTAGKLAWRTAEELPPSTMLKGRGEYRLSPGESGVVSDPEGGAATGRHAGVRRRGVGGRGGQFGIVPCRDGRALTSANTPVVNLPGSGVCVGCGVNRRAIPGGRVSVGCGGSVTSATITTSAMIGARASLPRVERRFAQPGVVTGPSGLEPST